MLSACHAGARVGPSAHCSGERLLAGRVPGAGSRPSHGAGAASSISKQACSRPCQRVELAPGRRAAAAPGLEQLAPERRGGGAEGDRLDPAAGGAGQHAADMPVADDPRLHHPRVGRARSGLGVAGAVGRHLLDLLRPAPAARGADAERAVELERGRAAARRPDLGREALDQEAWKRCSRPRPASSRPPCRGRRPAAAGPAGAPRSPRHRDRSRGSSGPSPWRCRRRRPARPPAGGGARPAGWRRCRRRPGCQPAPAATSTGSSARELRLDRALRRLEQAALDRLALGVERVQLAREVGRLLGRVGREQAGAEVGAADPPAGIDPRAEREAELARVGDRGEAGSLRRARRGPAGRAARATFRPWWTKARLRPVSGTTSQTVPSATRSSQPSSGGSGRAAKAPRARRTRVTATSTTKVTPDRGQMLERARLVDPVRVDHGQGRRQPLLGRVMVDHDHLEPEPRPHGPAARTRWCRCPASPPAGSRWRASSLEHARVGAVAVPQPVGDLGSRPRRPARAGSGRAVRSTVAPSTS